MASEDFFDAKQPERLMLSVNRLRGAESLCDFVIKVGEKSFPVHRLILAASSHYFEGMFLSNMKEVKDGFVEIKDIDESGIEQCIEFIYKGKAKISMKNIQNMLHASDLLQIEALKILCSKFLLKNLSSDTCLTVVHLADIFSLADVKNQAELVVVNNFDFVLSSDAFSSITKNDLLRYINNLNVTYQTTWKAILKFVEINSSAVKKHFREFLNGIEIKKFPFEFILKTILEEPFVKDNKETSDFVIAFLISDNEFLEKNLDIDNCFTLKSLAQNLSSDSAKIIINQFLEVNFEGIVKKQEFCLISKEEIVCLLSSHKIECVPETVKYNAAIDWVKHDLQNRKKEFQGLFSLVKLEKIPLDFLQNTVKFQTLVKKSEKCTEMLMNELFSRLSIAQIQLGQQIFIPANVFQHVHGEMSHRVLRGIILEGFPPQIHAIEIIYYFHGGSFQGLSYRT
ncbi:kelch-like protein 7 [Styela clava]